jgi:hypothetical protein
VSGNFRTWISARGGGCWDRSERGVGFGAVLVDERWRIRKRVAVTGDEGCGLGVVAGLTVYGVEFVGVNLDERVGAGTKTTGEFAFGGRAVRAGDIFVEEREIGTSVVTRENGGGVVTEGHFDRRPFCFVTTVVMDDGDRWSEEDESKAGRTTLCESQTSAFQSRGVIAVKKVCMVTSSAAKAAEFPERVGAHFAFVVFGTAEMDDVDARVGHQLFLRINCGF